MKVILQVPYFPADRPHFFPEKNGTEIRVAAYTRVQEFWHVINMQEISRSYTKLAS